MILFFDIKRLEQTSQKTGYSLLVLLKALKANRILKRFPEISTLKGRSFLLNPDSLFEDRSTDPVHIAQYIKLAGRRSYSLYKVFDVTYLDLALYPEADIQQLKYNPLLKIVNNKIQFKYEDE